MLIKKFFLSNTTVSALAKSYCNIRMANNHISWERKDLEPTNKLASGLLITNVRL